MNPHPQPFAGQGRAPNGHGMRQSSARQSGDFRSPLSPNATPMQNGHGMAVPRGSGANNMGNGQGQFAGARSPPSQQKNTSHVPCKFFRQGTCQAGQACPFLHGEITQPCKYFQKGNCKFGLKCANDHITPDGRRVNKSTGYVMPGPLNLGGRVMPPPPGPQSANSLLTMQAQDQFAQPQPIPGAVAHHGMGGAPDIYTNDTSYNSLPKSNFGSPPGDPSLLISPQLRGLTAAQAQLPASFDSQGISKYARDGPFAASVPSRFGFDSSPPAARPIESSALRNLHSSAFGDDAQMLNGMTSRGGLPSSPPAEDLVGRRILHSERYSSRNTNPRMLSASVGARPPLLSRQSVQDEEWDDAFALEEEMVPNSLHDLLTPAEKARRFSRSAEDERDRAGQSLPISGLGTPAEATSKVGSPSHASPSRFGAFFAGRARDGSESSPFGPVGSPLRGSGFGVQHPSASPSLRATANARPLSGDLGPISSPPRQASMSMISQQLQRTRLTERVNSSEAGVGVGSPGDRLTAPIQHPGISRVASGGSIPSSPPTAGRTVSSSSVGRDKIEEEPEELFDMELGRTSDDLPGGAGVGVGSQKENVWKRSSGGLSGGAWAQGNPFALGKASPRLGPIGGQRTAAGKMTGGTGAGNKNGNGI